MANEDVAKKIELLAQAKADGALDRFSTERCGCRVEDAAPGYAVCSFDITPEHLNGIGLVMGGAIFTLADFAMGVAAGVGQEPSVSVSNSIEFMSPAKGHVLRAVARADRAGRSIGFYTVDVTDELGTQVAKMTATCFKRG